MDGHGGKVRQHVDRGDSPRRLLHARSRVGQCLAYLREQLEFQRGNAVLCGQDRVFQLLQLLRDVAFTVCKRLLADIIVGHHIDLPLGHLDGVAEHAVIPHAQVPDAGFFFFPRFDLEHTRRAVFLHVAQVIDLLAVALADHFALADGKGGIVHDGAVDEIAQIIECVELLAEHLKHGRIHRGQTLPDLRQAVGAARQRNKVAAVGRAGDDARDDALEIGHVLERKDQLLAVDVLFDQLVHGRKPLSDQRRRQQRPFHPRPEQASAHGGAGLVQHPQEASLLLL